MNSNEFESFKSEYQKESETIRDLINSKKAQLGKLKNKLLYIQILEKEIIDLENKSKEFYKNSELYDKIMSDMPEIYAFCDAFLETDIPTWGSRYEFDSINSFINGLCKFKTRGAFAYNWNARFYIINSRKKFFDLVSWTRRNRNPRYIHNAVKDWCTNNNVIFKKYYHYYDYYGLDLNEIISFRDYYFQNILSLDEYNPSLALQKTIDNNKDYVLSKKGDYI